jgi:hypothetical protein
MAIAVNNSTYLTGIQSIDTRKHCHESAFMAAIHILACLTLDNKTYQEIAADFDNNLELVVVWVDYLTKLNWLYKNKSDDKCVATEEGKRFIRKLLQRTV